MKRRTLLSLIPQSSIIAGWSAISSASGESENEDLELPDTRRATPSGERLETSTAATFEDVWLDMQDPEYAARAATASHIVEVVESRLGKELENYSTGFKYPDLTFDIDLVTFVEEGELLAKPNVAFDDVLEVLPREIEVHVEIEGEEVVCEGEVFLREYTQSEEFPPVL